MFLGVLISIGMFAFAMYYLYSTLRDEANDAKKRKNSDSIEEGSGTLALNIKKFGPQNREFFSITEARDVNSYSHGPTLHVGSVSVGNVTSGGAYVTPGYTTYSSGAKNGFYKIEYCESPVCEIQFEDFKQRYKLREELEKSKFSSHVKNGYSYDYINCYHMTKEECDRIIDFICNEKMNQYK